MKQLDTRQWRGGRRSQWTRRLSWVAGALVVLSTSAALASPPVDALVDRLADRPALLRAVEPVLRQAERLQLPTALLIDKAREAAAKRVPPALVGTVLTRLMDGLKHAASVLPESLRSGANLESIARATLAGCSVQPLISVVPSPVTDNVSVASSSLRRVSALCTDLRAAGLPPEESGRLAASTVARSRTDASLDGTLVRIVRHAGSPESARLVAREVSAALTGGASVRNAVGTVVANQGVGTPPGLDKNGVPETSSQKASANKGAGNNNGIGHGSGNADGTDKLPPGQTKDKDKAIPPGQEKKQ